MRQTTILYMPLNPIIALDHVIEEYRDHLQSEFRARDRVLRGALSAGQPVDRRSE